MKSNRIDESKTATINDDSVNTGLRLVNFNSTCPWSPFLFQRNWFLLKKFGNNQTFKQSRQLRACSKHNAIEFSHHDHKRGRTSRDINGFGAKRRHPTTMPASQRSKQKVEKKVSSTSLTQRCWFLFCDAGGDTLIDPIAGM